MNNTIEIKNNGTDVVFIHGIGEKLIEVHPNSIVKLDAGIKILVVVK
jgi:hypothetical protein